MYTAWHVTVRRYNGSYERSIEHARGMDEAIAKGKYRLRTINDADLWTAYCN